jgi:hypothetical protein
LVKLLKDQGVVIDGIPSEEIAKMGWNLIMQIIEESTVPIEVPQNFEDLIKFINEMDTKTFEKELEKLGIKVSLPKLPGGGIKVSDFFPLAMLFLTWIQTGNIPLPKPSETDPTKVEAPSPGCFPQPNDDKKWGEILTKLPIDIPSSEIIKQGVDAASEVADKVAKGDVGGAIETGMKKGEEILGKKTTDQIIKTLGDLLKGTKVMY